MGGHTWVLPTDAYWERRRRACTRWKDERQQAHAGGWTTRSWAKEKARPREGAQAWKPCPEPAGSPSSPVYPKVTDLDAIEPAELSTSPLHVVHTRGLHKKAGAKGSKEAKNQSVWPPAASLQAVKENPWTQPWKWRVGITCNHGNTGTSSHQQKHHDNQLSFS